VHAVVVRVTITNREGAEQRLRDEVVPRASSALGFQTGYWTREGDSGLSMAIFDSEENARAAAERIPTRIRPSAISSFRIASLFGWQSALPR
jgi:hypothetical protein